MFELFSEFNAKNKKVFVSRSGPWERARMPHIFYNFSIIQKNILTIYKDAAHEEALKREIERLGQLYHRQQKNHRIECNVPSAIVGKEPTSPGDQKHKLLYV